MAYDDLFPADLAGYQSAHDQMDRAIQADIRKRAAAAGIDCDTFDSLEDCDLYMQSQGI